jgi:NAD(P)-dependent dehydrogenase (short-subunit alcohol dehydrogenase family)
MSLLEGSNQMKILLAVGAFVILRSVQKYHRYRRLSTQQMNGNIAVVTGCASGIGLEICLKLAHNGWKVFGLDINEKGLVELGETSALLCLNIITQRVDISDVISCDEALERISSDANVKARGVDLLVNNAGVIFPSPMLDTPWNRVQQMYGVNVLVSCDSCSCLSVRLFLVAMTHLTCFVSLGGGGDRAPYIWPASS